MMKLFYFTSLVIYFMGCQEHQDNLPVPAPSMYNQLAGTWKSPPDSSKTIEGEWGPVRITMKLSDDRKIELNTEILESPGGPGGTLNSSGTYSVENGIFKSDAIDHGKPIEINLEKDQLHFRLTSNNETYVFVRQKKDE